MQRDIEIMRMDKTELIAAWETCVKELALASVALDDEIAKANTANVSIGSKHRGSADRVCPLAFARRSDTVLTLCTGRSYQTNV